MEEADRRASGVNRVDLSTLVEICGQDGKVPAFEAQSSNVSGRGMLVRTSYLPEIGDQLVCRFEHQRSEVLVEGRVAWRAEGDDGGEFGIQFTALDAASVHVLKALSHVSPAPPSVVDMDAASDDEDEDVAIEPGSPVRLHIEGLGAPMKARVHEGTPRKVRVGSNLEFLKVGRELEIENVQAGIRQGAHIDSVSVTVNPATQIPELVVALRYEGADTTPEPSVVESPGAVTEDPARAELEACVEHEEEAEDEEAGVWIPDTGSLRERFEGAVRGASDAAKEAQGMFGRIAGGAAEGAARLAKGASQQMSQRALDRAATKGRRRTASAPVGVRSSVQGLKRSPAVARTTTQRRTSARPAAPQKQSTPKGKRVFALGGLLVVGVGSAFALRAFEGDEAPLMSKEVAAVEAAPAPNPAVSAPAAEAPEAAPSPTDEVPRTEDGIVANVPLFGPKAMATAEPAPLGAENDVDDATAERQAAAASVDDESWEDEEPKPAASDSKPWGRGRLHLPTIHRVRLDGAGEKLAGALQPTGFTVVVPGRKAMESGRAIQKRDKRIAEVKASNTDQGASITFKFRGKVPPYRVRLRNDFVEFLISAPEGDAVKL